MSSSCRKRSYVHTGCIMIEIFEYAIRGIKAVVQYTKDKLILITNKLVNVYKWDFWLFCSLLQIILYYLRRVCIYNCYLIYNAHPIAQQVNCH